MAELEIHHETEVSDPFGQRTGILAAVLAAGLAIVTIASHRAHTDAVVKKTEANDQWSYYQSTRLKEHNLTLGQDLISLLGPQNAASAQMLARYRQEQHKYNQKAEEQQKQAREREQECLHAEHQALRYDLGEGLLEIGLVLTSLYFISKKRFFPAIGVVAGVAGTILAIMGILS